jgi:L-ascorbate metabolism protein UlaG (beta-lactamase superfamily)
MELTWWGTAGFRIRTGTDVFLIDPYLTRNPAARPVQPLKSADVAEAGAIFLTHGHFDHILDAPAIASRTGARVYTDPVAAQSLIRMGLAADRIETVTEDGRTFDFGAFQAQAHFSLHVRFDTPLVIRTLARSLTRIRRLIRMLKDYPCGQVLSWRFLVEGRAVHHFGSAGSTPDELLQLARRPTDVLMVPLQGHSRITAIALEYVRALRPRIVIPHHHDDFYPTISQMVDPGPFAAQAPMASPGTQVLVPEMNQPLIL